MRRVILLLAACSLAGCVGEPPAAPEEGSLEDRVGVLEVRVAALEEENENLRAEQRRPRPVTSEPPRTPPATQGLAPADPSPPTSPVPAAEDEQKWAVELLDVSSRVTEANDSWRRFAWRLTVLNHTTRTITFGAEIKFLDAEGFIVDTDSESGMTLQPGERRTFTGDDLVRMPGARNVSQVGADLDLK